MAELDTAGARLLSGTVDLRRFKKRGGELLAKADLLDKRIGREFLNDIALTATPGEMRSWEVSGVSLSAMGLIRRRRSGRVTGWEVLIPMFGGINLVAAKTAELRELHPADAADQISALSEIERHAVPPKPWTTKTSPTSSWNFPKARHRRSSSTFDVERAADVLEEMDSDDAADVIAELPAQEREDVLAAMEPEESESVRRLLQYLPDTAGGLMNPDPLILSGTATVAEALARIRDPDTAAAEAAQVFVTEAPHETPTGRYLGPVGFQRLLREPPSTPLALCLDEMPEPVTVDLPTAEIARRLASVRRGGRARSGCSRPSARGGERRRRARPSAARWLAEATMSNRTKIAERFGPRARLDLSQPRRPRYPLRCPLRPRAVRHLLRSDRPLHRYGPVSGFSKHLHRALGFCDSVAPKSWRFDEYPMQFLTLILSLQARMRPR